MAELKLEDSNFEKEVLKAKEPVLVDFWAEWCAPCRMVGPVVSEVAEELSGKAKVGKLNVDENQETAGKYGVMSIPTLMIFKDGEVVETMVGVQPKEALKENLQKHIK